MRSAAIQSLPSKQADDYVGGTSLPLGEYVLDYRNDDSRLMFAQCGFRRDLKVRAAEKVVMAGFVLGDDVSRHGRRQTTPRARANNPALDLLEGLILVRKVDYLAHCNHPVWEKPS